MIGFLGADKVDGGAATANGAINVNVTTLGVRDIKGSGRPTTCIDVQGARYCFGGWIGRVVRDASNMAKSLAAPIAQGGIVARLEDAVNRAKAAGTAEGAGQPTVDFANAALNAYKSLGKDPTQLESALNSAIALASQAWGATDIQVARSQLRRAIDSLNAASAFYARVIAAYRAMDEAVKNAERQLPIDQAKARALADLRARTQRAIDSAKAAQANAERANAVLAKLAEAKPVPGAIPDANTLRLSDATVTNAQKAVEAANQAAAAANGAATEASKPDPNPTQVTYYASQVDASARAAKSAADMAEAAAAAAIAAIAALVPPSAATAPAANPTAAPITTWGPPPAPAATIQPVAPIPLPAEIATSHEPPAELTTPILPYSYSPPAELAPEAMAQPAPEALKAGMAGSWKLFLAAGTVAGVAYLLLRRRSP
jgi:hypothetical protein